MHYIYFVNQDAWSVEGRARTKIEDWRAQLVWVVLELKWSIEDKKNEDAHFQSYKVEVEDFESS